MGRGWVNAIREAQGAKKGKVFTKLAKEISVAVKLGGDNPEANARLRAALKEAQKNSMPKDTIERAIKRGLGGGADADLEEINYEGYGPHGVAVIVEALTDNRNRTAQDVRAIFSRYGTNMGESGSVAWMFDRVSQILAKNKSDVDAEEAAINAGANEVENAEDGRWIFFGSPSDHDAIQKELEKMGWDVLEASLAFKAKNPIALDEVKMNDVKLFLEKIEDHDDVKRVHLAV